MTTNLSHSSENPEAHATPHRQPLKTRLLANIPQKFIALICTLILFTIAIHDRNMTVDFENIPITVTVPQGFATLDDTSDMTVNITLHGRASLLRGLNRDDLGAIALTAPAREGNVQLTLRPTLLSLPDGIRIEKFSPEFVNLNLEPLDRRHVTISTDHALIGNLLPGYQLGAVTLNPSTIEVYGPKSVIRDTSQLYIEPIDLTGKSATFTTTRWVILNRNGLHATSDKIDVTVNIVSDAKQRFVLGVPIVPLNLSSPYAFVPPTIDLTLVGDESALKRLDPSQLFITVDAAADNASSEHSRVIAPTDFQFSNLPQGVGVDLKKLPTVLLKVLPSRETTDTLPDDTPVP